MTWAENVNYKPLPREEATHLVIGSAPAANDPEAWDRGIIATAGDELTAHRIRREINNCFGAHVFVIENNSAALDVVHEVVLAMLEGDDAC